MARPPLAVRALLFLVPLPQGASDAPPGTSASETAPLAAALAKIRPEALASDVFFLADDDLAGRDTPSPGLRAAALYLCARVERLGFEPPSSRGWRAVYPLVERSMDVPGSTLTLRAGEAEVRLAYGTDYFLTRMSHVTGRTTEGRIVSIGGGSGGEFAGAELEGAWALVLERGLAMRRALRNARKRGAVGVLLVRDTEAGRPYADRFGATTRIASEPRLFNPANGSPPDLDEPALLALTPAAAEQLISLSSASFDGDWPHAGLDLEVVAREERRLSTHDMDVANVGAFWRGSDPDLSDEVIVVSAHFDHVGTRSGEIFNGADDNASGTAGLLGVAEALAAYGPLRRSILLLWLSGEEKGLWGSAAWARSPVLPVGARPVVNLNLDMIGRTAPDELYLTPTRAHASYNELARALYELAPLEGFPDLLSQDDDWARSDHYNFDRILEIPVAFLSAGEHQDYHRPTDTAEKIDFEKMARVVRLVMRALDRIQGVALE